MQRRQTGLTLIEIMIAVAIIAILAAVAIPAYQRYVLEGRYSAAIQDMRQMQIVFDDLAADRDLAAIEPAGYGGGTDLNVFSDENGVRVDVPGAGAWLDPWDNAYLYNRDAGQQTYTVRSRGPDGADGSSDDQTLAGPN